MVLGSALDGIRSLRHAGQLMASDAELNRLFEHLFELRRREPRDDIVSRLVAAEGDQITPAEMLPMFSLLLVAGFETTVNLISNAVLALLGHPGQWPALCADPDGLAAPGPPRGRPRREHRASRGHAAATTLRPAAGHYRTGRRPGTPARSRRAARTPR